MLKKTLFTILALVLTSQVFAQEDTASSRITTRRNQGQLIKAAIETRAPLTALDDSVAAITAADGVTLPTQTPVIWATGGSTVLATSGTDAAATDGDRYWTEIQIPSNVTLTGGFYLIGSVGGTDSVVVELFNNAGTKVASSLGTDTEAADLVGTAANIQKVAFSSTYAAVAGKYFLSVQFNGTTAKFRAYPIPGSAFIAATAAGTFKTSASITPGTTFTADKGPIGGVY